MESVGDKEQLTEELKDIVTRLYNTMEGTPEEKIKELNKTFKDAVKSITEISKKESKKESKTSIIEKLLYQVRDVPEIADKANCSEAYVRTIASNKKIYIKSRVIREIENGRSNEEIAQEGRVDVNAVQTVREEYNGKPQVKQQRQQGKEKEEDRDRKLRYLYAEGKPLKEIMENLHYKSISYVSQRKKKIGAYSRKEIIALLDTKTDTEIATDARLDEKTIAKIRQEANERKVKSGAEADESVMKQEEQEKQEDARKKQEKKVRKQRHQEEPARLERQMNRYDMFDVSPKFLECAQNFESVRTIIARTGLSEDGVEIRYLKTGIYTRKQVIDLIREGKMTDAEIATQGHGREQAVTQIRAILRKLDSLKPEVKQQIQLQLKREYASPLQIAQSLRGTVSLAVIKEINEEMNNSPKTKEQRYNSAMNSLRSQNVNAGQPTSNCSELIKKIERERISEILELYSEFLTELDYAYIAFKCVTIRDIFRAINIGEQFLGLNDSSEEGIKRKIFKVIERNKATKEAKEAKEAKETKETKETSKGYNKEHLGDEK